MTPACIGTSPALGGRGARLGKWHRSRHGCNSRVDLRSLLGRRCAVRADVMMRPSVVGQRESHASGSNDGGSLDERAGTKRARKGRPSARASGARTGAP